MQHTVSVANYIIYTVLAGESRPSTSTKHPKGVKNPLDEEVYHQECQDKRQNRFLGGSRTGKPNQQLLTLLCTLCAHCSNRIYESSKRRLGTAAQVPSPEEQAIGETTAAISRPKNLSHSY